MNTTTASAAATVVNAATRVQSMASRTVDTARTEVLKEPLGFIKLVQFVLAIITFGVAVNGGDTIRFSSYCNKNVETVSATYSYPYDLASTKWDNLCKDENQTTISSDSSTSIVASAGFFVFVGVISFLYSLAFIIIYLLFKHKYDNWVFFPLIDFACTTLVTIFWFCASIAWAKAISDIKDQTNIGDSQFLSKFNVCRTASSATLCRSITPYPTYASLIVSCIFGFGNIILWGGNMWFVLKETGWYKMKRQQQQQQQQQQQAQPSTTYNPNNKI